MKRNTCYCFTCDSKSVSVSKWWKNGYLRLIENILFSFSGLYFLIPDYYGAGMIHHTWNSTWFSGDAASCSLSASYLQHSLHTACVASSSPLPSSCWAHFVVDGHLLEDRWAAECMHNVYTNRDWEILHSRPYRVETGPVRTPSTDLTAWQTSAWE